MGDRGVAALAGWRRAGNRRKTGLARSSQESCRAPTGEPVTARSMLLNTVSHIGVGIHDSQQPACLVMLDQRLGLRLVHFQSLADDLFLVVRAAASGAACRRRSQCGGEPGGEVYTLNTRPQSWQILRPVRRLNRMPRSRFSSTTASSGCPDPRSNLLQGFGLRNVARKPVQNETLERVGLRQAARGSCRARWHHRPACPRPWPPWRATQLRCAWPPPRAADRRSISAARRRSLTSSCDWVPLPDPGAPNRTIRMILQSW